MGDDQNKNLFLAMALCAVVLVIWTYMFPPPEVPVDQAVTEVTETNAGVPSAEEEVTTTAPEATAEAAPEAPRITIETPSLDGSLSLAGGRIDQLSLKNYHQSLEPNAPEVEILAPVGTGQPYYTVFGWVPGGALDGADVPGPETRWTVESGTTLTPETPVTLRWNSPSGLIFRREVSVDNKFMFTVEQSVENPTGDAVRLAPYGVIAREGEPESLTNIWVIHEGAIRMRDGIRDSYDFEYDEIQDLGANEQWGPSSDVVEIEENGWVGFTDHYWMSVLVPEQGKPFTSVIQYVPQSNTYRTIARSKTLEVAPGATASSAMQVFAGAKEWETIRDYEAGRDIEGFSASIQYALFGDDIGIPGFIESIEWGWYAFLTKPIFFALHEFNALIGNMGWAIIALTLLIKALLFPLARKSYVSMAKMKELQPEMEKIKERAGDDRQALQKEMMELYKKEKVNPAAGCLPILLQIPIFFSLYKVIFVTLELRHAPWFGPFQDLSAPDPTSIFNLYGLLPWDGPEPLSIMAIIFIGILPLLLGVSMWLQQKLNPAPTDPTQQMIFAWMPWVFMFMLGTFASGLVVYWIANNTITFIQQYTIMRSHGYKPDIWGNITGKNKADLLPTANKDKKPKE